METTERGFHVKPGDVVEIAGNEPGFGQWRGLRCRVAAWGMRRDEMYLTPLSDRPDGWRKTPFYWPVGELLVVAE